MEHKGGCGGVGEGGIAVVGRFGGVGKRGGLAMQEGTVFAVEGSGGDGGGVGGTAAGSDAIRQVRHHMELVWVGVAFSQVEGQGEGPPGADEWP